MELDKNILFDNIAFLLKKQGKKVGELENAADVSAGYISRTKDGNGKPGLDFVVKVADFFGVSMDALLKVRFSALTATEEYIVRFLEKLTQDTEADCLDWKKETETDANICYHPDDMVMDTYSHPLFRVIDGGGDPEVEFISHSYGDKTYINVSYNVNISDSVSVYLVFVTDREAKDFMNIGVKELWLVGRSGRQFLCDDVDSPAGIGEMIKNLFCAVEENIKHPKIKEEYRDAIDSYLNGVDEELPFN